MPNPDIKQGTSLLMKVLSSGQITATGDQTILTVAALSAVKISSFALHNPGNTAVLINKVSLVPSGGSNDTTKQLTSNLYLNAGTTATTEDLLAWLKEAVLDAGTTIVVNAVSIYGATLALNYLITGTVAS